MQSTFKAGDIFWHVNRHCFIKLLRPSGVGMSSTTASWVVKDITSAINNYDLVDRNPYDSGPVYWSSTPKLTKLASLMYAAES